MIGRSLRIEEISPDEARRELLKIGPLPALNMLLQAWHAASGQPEHVTSTVAKSQEHGRGRSATGPPITRRGFERELEFRIKPPTGVTSLQCVHKGISVIGIGRMREEGSQSSFLHDLQTSRDKQMTLVSHLSYGR